MNVQNYVEIKFSHFFQCCIEFIRLYDKAERIDNSDLLYFRYLHNLGESLLFITKFNQYLYLQIMFD